MKRLLLLLIPALVASQSNAQVGLNLDGVNDYVNCGNSTATDITGTAITLEAWIYPTSFQPNIWQGNVINRNDVSQSGYMLRVGGTGQINFNFGSFGAWNELNSGTGVITLNMWQHIAATYDGTTSRIYVNGVEIASQAYSSSIASATAPLYLGEDTEWNGRFFPGSIDEVRIWNSTRTSAEINASMNNELCTTDPNLMAYYRFNDGVAGGNNAGQITLTDDSGNNNNGTLMNVANTGNSSNWITGAVLGQGMTNTIAPVEACDTYTWAVNGQTYTTSGTHSELLTGSTGCDSVVTLYLTIISPNNLTSNQVACDSYTWGVNGQTYTASATVVEDLTTSQGCPYQHTLNLTINQGFSATETIESCDSYTWAVDGNTYTTSGSYPATFTAQNGCDSTYQLDLTILPSLTADITSNVDGTLSTTFTGQLSWYDCDNDMVFAGQSGMTFTPTANGNYAVIVSDGASCPDTSSCIAVDYVGMSIIGPNEFALFVEPNPTSGQITVTLPFPLQSAIIQIVDAKGTVLQTREILNNDPVELVIDNVPGIYFVKAQTEYGWITKKVIKL